MNDGLMDHARSNRYNITARLQWRQLRPASLPFMDGLSIDISSGSNGGIQIESAIQPVVGTKIEIRLDWPECFKGVPLRLWIKGKVVRLTGRGFAVRFDKQPEFKTAMIRTKNENEDSEIPDRVSDRALSTTA